MPEGTGGGLAGGRRQVGRILGAGPAGSRVSAASAAAAASARRSAIARNLPTRYPPSGAGTKLSVTPSLRGASEAGAPPR